MKEKTLSAVSVIIPCYNEEKFISKCLASVFANDYPSDKLKIMVIDGMSIDRTRLIVETFTKQYKNIRILENIHRFKSFALNLGIRESTSEVIMVLDAHSTYPSDYISKCVYYLNKHNADNAGGIWNILSSKQTLFGESIAITLGHKFGSGNALYKTLKEGVVEADTVFGGCYRRSVFDRIGLFNEKLERSMDMEFNQRLRKVGGKIILTSSIYSNYYVRSDLWSFIKHNIADGQWSILPFKYSTSPIRLRHLLPFLFVCGLIVGPFFSLIHICVFFFYVAVLLIYLFLDIYFSFEAAKRKKDIRLFFPLLVVFPSRHLSYGIGALIGFVKLLLTKRNEN